MDNKSDISEIQSYITANLNEEFCVAILVTKRSKFVVHGRRCIILAFQTDLIQRAIMIRTLFFPDLSLEFLLSKQLEVPREGSQYLTK